MSSSSSSLTTIRTEQELWNTKVASVLQKTRELAHVGVSSGLVGRDALLPSLQPPSMSILPVIQPCEKVDSTFAHRTTDLALMTKRAELANPFVTDLSSSSWFLCGSAASMLISGTASTDNDYFVVAETEEEALNSMVALFRSIFERMEELSNKSKMESPSQFSSYSMDVRRGKHCFTLIINEYHCTEHRRSPGQSYRLQFILRLYQHVEEILFGFDWGISMVAWDGRDVRMTPLAAFALNHGIMPVDLNARSPRSFERRAAKYLNRGFALYCLELDWWRLHRIAYDLCPHYHCFSIGDNSLAIKSKTALDEQGEESGLDIRFRHYSDQKSDQKNDDDDDDDAEYGPTEAFSDASSIEEWQLYGFLNGSTTLPVHLAIRSNVSREDLAADRLLCDLQPTLTLLKRYAKTRFTNRGCPPGISPRYFKLVLQWQHEHPRQPLQVLIDEFEEWAVFPSTWRTCMDGTTLRGTDGVRDPEATLSPQEWYFPFAQRR